MAIRIQFITPAIYKKSQSYDCIQRANRGRGTNVIQTCQHLQELFTHS